MKFVTQTLAVGFLVISFLFIVGYVMSFGAPPGGYGEATPSELIEP